MNAAGIQAVDLVAEEAAKKVDELMGKPWSRRDDNFTETAPKSQPQEKIEVSCSCNSGILTQNVQINGEEMSLFGLPLIYKNFFERGVPPKEEAGKELMETIKIYNEINPEKEAVIQSVVLDEYIRYYHQQEVKK